MAPDEIEKQLAKLDAAIVNAIRIFDYQTAVNDRVSADIAEMKQHLALILELLKSGPTH